MASRGRVSYNRLTREERENTVRDLLGVQFALPRTLTSEEPEVPKLVNAALADPKPDDLTVSVDTTATS